MVNALFPFLSTFSAFSRTKVIHLGYFYELKRSAMVLSDQIVSFDATKHNSSAAISVCVMQHRNRPQGRIRFQGVKPPPPIFKKCAKFTFFILIRPVEVEKSTRKVVLCRPFVSALTPSALSSLD